MNGSAPAWSCSASSACGGRSVSSCSLNSRTGATSWCSRRLGARAGREREIEIRTQEQREAVDQAHRLVGKGSMIPSERSYIEQVKIYERQTAKAGLHKLHGLRHAYAQRRYEELTGWAAPAASGPTSADLTSDQKALDHEARKQISKELGHDRVQIVAVYLGR